MKIIKLKNGANYWTVHTYDVDKNTRWLWINELYRSDYWELRRKPTFRESLKFEGEKYASTYLCVANKLKKMWGKEIFDK